MTSVGDLGRRLQREPAAAPRPVATRRRPPYVVLAAATAAVLVRLTTSGLPPGADEAGFLQVARQWAPGGGSLYGDYWVDRPPLLITLFQLADAGGGLLALRLLGCVAVAATVLAVAWCAHLVTGGDRAAVAARWAAVAAAALTVSPLLDALEVNGELLALPFVAVGAGAALAALRAPARRHRDLAWAALSGAAGLAAVLVKQNLVDVAVFGAVLGLVALVRREVTWGRLARLAASWVAGAALCVGAVAAWTLAHGTSLGSVLYAMYPFRLAAAQVVAAAGSRFADTRLDNLLTAWVAGGPALLCLLCVWAALRSRLRDPATVALAATLTYDLVSVALGGGYWLHYLLQLVVPVSVAVGVLVGRGARVLPRLAVGLTVAASLVTLVAVTLHPLPQPGVRIGEAVGAVARPGDTLTTLYGEPQVNLAAGLPSPYPYLWSLPVKTLDPRLSALDAVLTGPDAPTWLVTTDGIASWGLETTRTAATVASAYHPVASSEGQVVYLRDGVTRATPDL